MINAYDIAYSLGLAISSPAWATRKKSREKVLTAFRQRFGQVSRRDGVGPAVWIHSVSLGEVNAARTLVAQLLATHEELQLILSTTTTTGFERLITLHANQPRIVIVRYPLDFSAAIVRALDALRPSVVVLMELETWPNFLNHCAARGIAVILANGRITTHSFSRYRWIRPIVATMLRRLSAICVQDAEYARRFEALGAPPSKITIAGTMKYDTADTGDAVEGADELQSLLRLEHNQPLWVCGSTGPGEEAIILGVYKNLQATFPRLKLAIIPRHPQRFDEVAKLIELGGFSIVRKSLLPRRALGEKAEVAEFAAPGQSVNQDPLPGNRDRETFDAAAVVLGDTMGELRKFYSLAAVVFVGRSLVDLGSRQHGSDMIEPAALGKPCIVGSFTGNFDQTVRALQAADAIVQVADASGLERRLAELLADPARAGELGTRARQVVAAQRGSTARHLEIIRRFLS